MATFTDLLANLDQSPQVRGRQFERICQWYLRHHSQYEAQLEDVWLWDEWPERDGRDLGIDLVARTKDGKLWAIQAKAYDPEKTLRKSDVDSFLANSAQKTFAFRLILTTCKDLTANLRKQFTQVEPPVSAQVFSDLESAGLIWPNSPDDLRAPKPEPKTPRDHQKEAIQGVLKGFKMHDRGRLVMACGTGKTLVGLWVADRLKAERTLVLLPSLSLLGQTMEEWLANGRRTPEVLAVCSDKTVRGDTDAWVSDTSELGIPVTTDPEEIAAFLDRPGPRLVFSTYQSSPEIAKAQKLTEAAFDLAVADEAHRCAGRVSGAFATVLDGEAILADRRLFMTATPRYFTGRVKKVAGLYNQELASMDEPDRFGPEFHKLTFGEAIERDLLSPYQVVVIGVDDPTYREYAQRGRLVTRDGKEITDAGTLATHIALAKAMKQYDLRRMITFHSRINRARKFAQDFLEVVEWMPKDEAPDGDLWCDHVSGKMPTSHRKARLDRLRGVDGGGRGLLANARCLGEGVDVPTLDGVAFLDHRRSQVDIVQNVGRAIRKAEHKQTGTIVLPVFIDSSEDPEKAVDSSAFKPVWDVLRALRDHDEDLRQILDRIRLATERGGAQPDWPDEIVLDLPVQVSIRFSQAIHARILDRVAERPLLTVPDVLVWADKHREHSGEWPDRGSGPVRDANNETWLGIDTALHRGRRGLPPGLSLAQVLAEHRGVRNKGDLNSVAIEEILSWADDHYALTGSWPVVKSGPVHAAPGETWIGINSALHSGLRGLPGGSSLGRVLSEGRGVRNIRSLSDLEEQEIIEWAKRHRDLSQAWPKRGSGPIPESPGDTWSSVDYALRAGRRGLRGGSSLSKFLAEWLGVRSHRGRPSLSEEQILEWADAYYKRTGAWPNQKSGPIDESAEVAEARDTWIGIDAALRAGSRGLAGGSSLSRLLAREGHYDRRHGPALSVQGILDWADSHFSRTGAWPKRDSGHIPEAPDDTWSRIDSALHSGSRGLAGGSSLVRLLAKHRQVRNPADSPDHTVDSILAWAKGHHRRTGRWPTQYSGPIAEAPGETWSAVNAALRVGSRGLPGGSSLAKLLDEHRRKK